MLKWLKHKYTQEPLPKKVGRVSSQIVYPPVDEGIPFLPVNSVLESQIEILRNIRLSSGLSEQDFSRLVVPVVRNLASYIHLLPATRNANHRGAGGLFRLGLEVGFYSLQAADGVIFSGLESSENRRISEPRWKFASLIAGLCSDLHHSVNSIIVINDKGDEWPVYQTPLARWMEKTGSARYFVKWKSADVDNDRMAPNTTFLLNQIIHPEAVQYMRDGSNKIVTGVMGVITRSIPNSENSTLRNIVYEIRKRVIERDAAVQPDHYGRMMVGAHMDPYIIDAMRQLVESGTWKINQPKSRMWLCEDGLFVIWGKGGKELKEMMEQSHTPGVPKKEETLLEMMATSGIVDLDGSDALFMVKPPGSESEMLAIKISNPYSVIKELADKTTPVHAITVKKHGKAINTVQSDQQDVASEPEPQHEVQQEAEASVSDTEIMPAVANEERNDVVEDPVAEDAVVEDESLSDGSKAILASLPPHLSEVMEALIQDAKKLGPNNNSAFQIKEGFAVSTDMLGSYGFNSTDLIKDIQKAGWLWFPPGQKNQKVHIMDRDGQRIMVIILSLAIAKQVGFPVKD